MFRFDIDVSDLEDAAIAALSDAEAATSQLEQASKVTSGLGYEDEEELEEAAEELLDALRSAERALEDALHAVRRVL